MIPRLALIALALAGTAWADPCEAPLPKRWEEFAGKITHVIDGDGFCVGEAQGGIEVRVYDLYAVELNEPGGAESKAIAERVLLGQWVRCQARNRSWDRVVAICALGDRLVSDLLVEAGVAIGGRGR